MSRGDLLTACFVGTDRPALTGVQWEVVLSQARRARLAGRLARRAVEQDWFATMPDAARHHLQGLLRVEQTRRNQTLWELDCLRRALRGAGFPIVLLKGAAYVAAALPPARGRQFGDIDLLVPRECLREVEARLLGAGWVGEKLDAYDERYYRDWMHELPPLTHVERGTALDVHHTIAPPTSRWKIDGARLLDRAREVPGEEPFFVLAPEDIVLHSAVHLMQEGDFGAGLRDLLDIDDLLDHFGRETGFWPTLAARAEALGVGVPLVQALDQRSRLFGRRPPGECRDSIERLAAPAPRRWLMRHLLAVALRPDHPQADGATTTLVRTTLYVRSHWLRMPWYRIVPHLLRKAALRTAARLRRPDRAEAGPAPGP